MPLFFKHGDITEMTCDAIVNAANPTLLGGGGVDGAIHRRAGAALLEECRTLGGCDTGDAKLTRAYELPCTYVIHTVGPVFQDGTRGEAEQLASCYRRSLELALSHGCHSVAFPLISAGAYGYPRDAALAVAVREIRAFLQLHELTVYMVFLDRTSLSPSPDLTRHVRRFLDERLRAPTAKPCRPRTPSKCEQGTFAPPPIRSASVCMDVRAPSASEDADVTCAYSLEQMLADSDDTFAVTLLKWIDRKGMTDLACYKKANVSKQTWYKIMNDPHYRPSKNTVLAFAIALELTLEQTQHLLSTVGFTLSKSSPFDIIIEYFLRIEEYDIFTINETLFRFDQACLGV